jgi:hypothetical protein
VNHGGPYILKNGYSAESVVFNLAQDSLRGPVSPQKVMLGDAAAADAAPPNTLTLDSIKYGSEGIFYTADNYTVQIGDKGQIYLWSDNATPANRTFNIPGPTNGRQLHIVWVQNGNSGQLVDNAANATGPGITLLNGNWEPTAYYQTITLIGVNDNWVEVARSMN